ncbi:MAG TPA: twin-arginine translocase TatA/TatE family subunit [Solirubrobacteraceae bacterium]|jgi:sec-independent protein translocase protein TatA|nr:twin-arginine translocase TatA/TatE family subunit [Solirubrobacteraceae bacterium]
MLGLDNPIHIAFILIVLLLVFGAKRLPEMGKSLGEGLRGFKDSISGESPASHMTAEPTAPRVDELTAASPMDITSEPEHHTVAAERPVERTSVTPAA